MREPVVKVTNGTTLVVSDAGGDIDDAGPAPMGLFAIDTRFLSRWLLTINGQRPTVLSTDDLMYFQTQFFLNPATGSIDVDGKLTVVRLREVSDGFRETVMMSNRGTKLLEVCVHVEAAADFARSPNGGGVSADEGSRYRRVDNDTIVFGYEHEDFHPETTVSANRSAQLDDGGLTFTVRLEPGEDWSAELRVEPAVMRPEGRIPLAALSNAESVGGRPETSPNLDEGVVS
jgi:hypothetical protein